DALSANIEARAAEQEKHSQTINKQLAQLDSLSTDLQARTAEFNSKESEFNTRRNQWENECRTREESLAARQDELNQQASQLETLQMQLHNEKEQWKHHLAQFESSSKPIQTAGNQQETAVEDSPSSDASVADVAFQSLSEKPSVEVDHILQRLERDIKQMQEQDNSPAETPQAPISPQPDQPTQSMAQPSDQQSSTHENEESVDSYMSRLMERIRSAQGELTNKSDNPYAAIPSKPDSVSSPGELGPTPGPITYTAPVNRNQPMELSPRTVAPEKKVDLTLLRDLANYSAKSALGTHARQQMTNIMYSKLTVALMGGITGIGLMWLWSTWDKGNLTYYSALLAFLAAVIWGIQYLLVTLKLIANGSDKLESEQAFHSKDSQRKRKSSQQSLSLIGSEGHEIDSKLSSEVTKAVSKAKENEVQDHYHYVKNPEQL
ncbi:MAG TPA: hypothetical protein VIH42_03420, partial [Thermoguttaceae bacterium]